MGARILGIVASIVLVGCQYDPFTEVYTTKQPKAEDLVGLYVPSEETKAFIANEGHYSPAESSITLSADGSVSMTNIPDWWLTPFGESQGRFHSYHGRWTVQKHQDWWVVGVSLDDATGTEVFLIGEKAPYKIHIILGDPDGGRGMDFVRSNT
jgi:hypothetical protein